MTRSTTQQSPLVRNAKRTDLHDNKQEADAIIAAIIEGRQDETITEGQAG